MKIKSKYRITQAASTDEDRYVLNGVYITPNGKQAVATDGRIMAIVPIEVEATDTLGCIVPSAAIEGAQKMAVKSGTAYVELNGCAKWMTKAGNASAEYVGGTYPNYKVVIPEIPEEHAIKLAFDANLLLKLARALCDESNGVFKDSRQVTLTIDKRNLMGAWLVKGNDLESYGVIMPCRPN